jgi:hypothetical protein
MDSNINASCLLFESCVAAMTGQREKQSVMAEYSPDLLEAEKMA